MIKKYARLKCFKIKYKALYYKVRHKIFNCNFKKNYSISSIDYYFLDNVHNYNSISLI